MTSPEQAPKKLIERVPLDVSDLRSASFWLAQACMVLATIAGVYLASNEGFTKAMEFYNVAEHKASYQMARALRAELVMNLEAMEAFAAAGKDQPPRDDGELPSLQRFVWQSVGESDRAFELPLVVLNGVQTYYGKSEELVRTAVDSRQWPDVRMRAVRDLEASNKTIRDKVLPALDAEMARRGEALKPYGLLPPE